MKVIDFFSLFYVQVTDRLAFFLRNVSDLENNVVSLERIKEYSNVEQEVRIDHISRTNLLYGCIFSF